MGTTIDINDYIFCKKRDYWPDRDHFTRLRHCANWEDFLESRADGWSCYGWWGGMKAEEINARADIELAERQRKGE